MQNPSLTWWWTFFSNILTACRNILNFMFLLRWVFHPLPDKLWYGVVWEVDTNVSESFVPAFYTLQIRQWFLVIHWYCSAPGFEVCTFPQLTSEVAGNKLNLSSLSAGREGDCVTSGSGSGRLYWDIQLCGSCLIDRGWVRKHAGATPRKPLPLCLEHFFVSTVLDIDVKLHTSVRYDIRWRIVRERAFPEQAPCHQKHLLHILCRYDVLIGWGKSDDPHRELVS